jgi:hypothetical protein
MRGVDRPDWAPDLIDVERPSPARIYDYFLGGSHNFAVDRESARQLIARFPEIPLVAQANRAFLRRVVRYLTGAGVRQFLDIGSGIPTVGNVHEIAQQADPGACVVYVDIDPVAVAHSLEILSGNGRTAVIHEDLRHPDRILEHPDLRAVLDLRQPTAVLIVSVLHFLSDADDPWGVTARFRAALAPGSYLAISHGTSEAHPIEDSQAGAAAYQRSVGVGLTPRSRDEIMCFFEGYELVEPGLTWISEWHPESTDEIDHPERSAVLGGVGRR